MEFFFTGQHMTTRKVYIGGEGRTKRIAVGGDAPVTVQTMWKESIIGLDTDDRRRAELVQKISSLQMLGCDILRFAVPDMESAHAFTAIAADTDMPLVADIHFDLPAGA